MSLPTKYVDPAVAKIHLELHAIVIIAVYLLFDARFNSLPSRLRLRLKQSLPRIISILQV